MGDERLPNGVRIRQDGKGDPCFNDHRRTGRRDLYTFDVDAFVFVDVWTGDGEDRIFYEYCRGERPGQMTESALVAMFDRKKARGSWCEKDARQLAGRFPWMSHCREVAYNPSRPVAPRFFWICGTDGPKWEWIEWDIKTGDRVHKWLLNSDDITKEWGAIGLLRNHAELVAWLKRGKTYAP